MKLNDYINEKEKEEQEKMILQHQKEEEEKERLQKFEQTNQKRIAELASNYYERICKAIAENIIKTNSVSGTMPIYIEDGFIARELVTDTKYFRGGGYYSGGSFPKAKMVKTTEYWEAFKKELSRLLNEDNIKHEYVVEVIYTPSNKRDRVLKTIDVNKEYRYPWGKVTISDLIRLKLVIKYSYTK